MRDLKYVRNVLGIQPGPPELRPDGWGEAEWRQRLLDDVWLAFWAGALWEEAVPLTAEIRGASAGTGRAMQTVQEAVRHIKQALAGTLRRVGRPPKGLSRPGMDRIIQHVDEWARRLLAPDPDG